MSSIRFDATLDISKLEAGIRQANKTVENWVQGVEKQASGMDKIMQRVGGAMATYFSVQALANFGKEIISVRGQFQQLGIAFETMLGSKEKADKLMQEAIVFAAKTPFTLVDVATNIKQLMAMGIATEDVMSTMKSLGDVAAGVSVPIARIAINYGQVATIGKLQGRELRDFAMAGVPLAQALADILGRQKDEIAEMVTAGQIGFPLVEQAFKNMSSEGGKFFNLMEKQNKSVTGQISNLADKWSVMLNEIGKSNEGLIYKGIGGISSLISNYKTAIEVLKGLVLVLGAVKVATIYVAHEQKIQAAMAILTAGATDAKTVAEARSVVMTYRAEAAQKALNKSMLLNPYVLAAAAIAALGFGLYKLITYQTDLEKATNKADIEIENEKDKVLDLFSALKAAKEGTEGYKTARQNIINQYGDLIPEQLKELGNLNDINEAQLLVNKSLTENIALKTKTEALQAISSEYNPKILDAQKDIINKVEKKLGEERAATVKYEIAGLVAQFKEGIPGAEKALVDYRQKLVAEMGTVNKQGLTTSIAGANMSGAFTPLLENLKAVKKETDLTIGAFKKYGEKAVSETPEVKKEEKLITASAQRLALKKQLVAEEKKLKDIEATPGKDPLKAVAEQEAVIKALKEQLKIEDSKKEAITEKKKSEDKIKKEEELLFNALDKGNDKEAKAIAARIKLLQDELTEREKIARLVVEQSGYEGFVPTKMDTSGLKIPSVYTDSKTGKKPLLSGLREISKPLVKEGKEAERIQAEDDKKAEDSIKRQKELKQEILKGALDLTFQMGQQLGLSEDELNVLGSQLDLIGSLVSGDYVGAAVNVLSQLIEFIPSSAETFAKQIEDINRLIEEQNRLIEASERVGGGEIERQKAITLLEKQRNDQAERLAHIQERGGGVLWTQAKTKKEIDKLTQAVKDSDYAILQANQDLDDFLTGGITQNTLADVIAQGFQEGKTSVDDFGEYMNEVLMDAVLDIFKQQILLPMVNAELMPLVQKSIEGGISKEEAANIAKITAGIAEKNKATWDSMTEGLDFGTSQSNNGLSGGIQRSITEQTGSELAGLFRRFADDNRVTKDYTLAGVNHLIGIEKNTLDTVLRLDTAIVSLQNIEKYTKGVPVGAF